MTTERRSLQGDARIAINQAMIRLILISVAIISAVFFVFSIYFARKNFDKGLRSLVPTLLSSYYSDDYRTLLTDIISSGLFIPKNMVICDAKNRFLISTPDLNLEGDAQACPPVQSRSLVAVYAERRSDPVFYIQAVKNIDWYSGLSFSIAVLCVVSVLFLPLIFLTNRQLTAYFDSIFSQIPELLSEVLTNDSKRIQAPPELEAIAGRIQTMAGEYKRLQVEIIEAREARIRNDLARQVAHDIRSPVSALNMVLGSLEIRNEEVRVLMRSAITRINDISNNLLARHQDRVVCASQAIQVERNLPCMLCGIVESLISEKRLQYRSFSMAKIEFLPDESSYDVFAVVTPSELKRILSNLINNSIEAFSNNGGMVKVVVRKSGSRSIIEVIDNGKGIPAEILPELGKAGKSYDKENNGSGSGLGLNHAFKTIKSWGGAIDIISTVGGGTTVRISLTASEPPSWFVRRLQIRKEGPVVVVDDDESIHRAWDERLKTLKRLPTSAIVHFSNLASFSSWIAKGPRAENGIFLIDYEFAGERTTGIDVIKNLNISNQTILVTSRNEEKHVLDEIERFRLQMIPKSMASLVPIDLL